MSRTPSKRCVFIKTRLDSRAAAERAALVFALVVANPEDANDGRDEPQDGRHKGEGDDSLPVAARVDTVDINAIPVEDVAA